MKKTVWDGCYQEEIPLELLDLKNHPTPTDLEKRLGKDLVDVFLKTCTPVEKIFFGRDKPLKGPSNENRMWINPEARLNGNEVKITQAPSPSSSYTDCLQALTHRGILEIGKKYEEKLLELNRKDVEDARKESEELSKFEADLRIKFHVETATKKLNEECERKMDQLKKLHEQEKRDMIEVFHDSRKVFCDFISKKFKQDTDKLIEEARAEVRQEMEGRCASIIDDELAQQQKNFEESMEVTLNNLAANDRDKMNELRSQCLRMMDVQHDLLVCRQMTELLHLIGVERRHCEEKLCEMSESYKATIESLQSRLKAHETQQQHPSKSIFTAALMTILNGVDDVNALDEHEKRIFDEIQRLMQSDSNHGDDDNEASSGTFIVSEAVPPQHQDSHKSDWIFVNVDNEEGSQNNSVSVAAQWERMDSLQLPQFDNAFLSSIFNETTSPTDEHTIPQIATSIVELIKLEHDEKNLEAAITMVLRKTLGMHRRETLQTLIPMPTTRDDPLRIRDSREIAHEKRISIVEPIEVPSRQELLGAIDSIEVFSHRVSSTHPIIDVRNSPPSFKSFTSSSINSHESRVIEEEPKFPSYMKVPHRPCHNFQKMTEEEWLQLQSQVKFSKDEQSDRKLSIQFENINVGHQESTSRHESKRNSILKWPSMEVPAETCANETNLLNDALDPIRKKCLEAVGSLKVESILRMLCDDVKIPKNP